MEVETQKNVRKAEWSPAGTSSITTTKTNPHSRQHLKKKKLTQYQGPEPKFAADKRMEEIIPKEVPLRTQKLKEMSTFRTLDFETTSDKENYVQGKANKPKSSANAIAGSRNGKDDNSTIQSEKIGACSQSELRQTTKH